MNDDGTMARTPDLLRFAQHHGLKIATIAGLIAYRLRYDRIIEKVLQTRSKACTAMPSSFTSMSTRSPTRSTWRW